MNRRDYAASHSYIEANPTTQVLLYPSCRDPRHGDNFAAFEVRCLAKHLGSQETLSFYFEPDHQSLLWMDYGLRISWKQIS